MTDNGGTYRSRDFAAVMATHQLRHLRTRPYASRTKRDEQDPNFNNWRAAMKRSPLVTLTLFTLFLAACDERPAVTEPALAADVGALTAKGPARDTPVASQFLGGGGTANLSLQSDGLGVYNNGVSGVSSILQAALSDWVLDLQTSTRKMSIDFTDALPGNPFSAPFTSSLVQPRLIAKASQLNAGSFRGMTGLGSTILSPLDRSAS